MKSHPIKLVIIISVSIFSCFFTKETTAQTLGSIKEQYRYIGINESNFNSLAIYGKQRNSMWCWAACVQMVLNFYNITVTQEQIVEKTLGEVRNKAATTQELFEAIDGGRYYLRGERPVIVKSNIITPTLKELSSFLKNQKPLIVGISSGESTTGHAMVLIGIEFDNQTLRPVRVTLADPWPGNSMMRYMDWEDFSDALVITYKIWMEPEIMKNQERYLY